MNLETCLPLLQKIRSSRYRWSGGAREEEDAVEEQFASSTRLAVYGTLAPGECNYPVIQPVGGSWEPAQLQGIRFTLHMGQDIGFPGYHWIPDGPSIRVQLLESPHLPDHWRRLDRFEGPDYCRILVPVFRNHDFYTIANTYECRHPAPPSNE